MSEEKLQRWSALRLRGLRQRWLFNTILPVSLVLVAVVVFFAAGITNYYYATMQKGLESRAQAMADSFNEYFMDNGYRSYYQKATQTVESFEDKGRIELQFLNSSGRIEVSTSGLTAGSSPGTEDINHARDNQMWPFQGEDPETGEKILAVSHPLISDGRVVGMLRLVTSLREVNFQILMALLWLCRRIVPFPSS